MATMIRRAWKSLFAGFDWSNPFDWVYLIIVIPGIVLVPAFILTGPPGWFLLVMYYCIVDGMKPDGPGRAEYQREVDLRKGPVRRGTIITEADIAESNWGIPTIRTQIPPERTPEA